MRRKLLLLAGIAATSFVGGMAVFSFLRPGDIACSIAAGVNLASVAVSLGWYSLW